MNKVFLLTLITLCCCFASRAQQPEVVPDSLADAMQTQSTGKDGVFVSFSAEVKEYNKVGLQWDVDSVEEGDYFIIERATDGNQYETIGAIRKTGTSNHYELTDIAPPNGTDFYRIKYSPQGGSPIYSKAVQVSLSGNVDFKFYPNPVDKLLIIRTAHAVEIQVIDAVGNSRLNKRLNPGIQVINISFLERGRYILRVADKESNKIISNQLLKN
ncbi:T9SS type A sorting domain-containing protein [Flavitalea flava]